MLRNQKRVKSSWIWIIPQSRKSRRVHPSTCQNGKISCQSVKTLSVESFILSFACTARFRVVCVHLVPCVSLVILNILLFSAIRKAERRRQKLMASRVKAEQAGLVKRWIRTDLLIWWILQTLIKIVEIGTTSARGTRTAPPWCWSWWSQCSCPWRRPWWSSQRCTQSRQGGEYR